MHKITNSNAAQAQIALHLKRFGLTVMREELAAVVELAESQCWSHLRFLEELCEREAHVRDERLLQRLIKQSELPEDKRWENLDQSLLAEKVRHSAASLLDGGFVDRHANVLAFGLPGRGKTHFLCALARELIYRQRRRVWFTPGFQLVERLLIAKREKCLAEYLKKLARQELIIIDDIGYVTHTREEMEILFTFFAERYERGSLMISSNLPFSRWDKIFQDPMTATAAVDRLVHRAIILEFAGESYRARSASGHSEKETLA